MVPTVHISFKKRVAHVKDFYNERTYVALLKGLLVNNVRF